jgi:hypothetical protein
MVALEGYSMIISQASPRRRTNGTGSVTWRQSRECRTEVLVIYSAMGDEGDNSNGGRSVAGEVGTMDICAPLDVPAERRVARTTSDLLGVNRIGTDCYV